MKRLVIFLILCTATLHAAEPSGRVFLLTADQLAGLSREYVVIDAREKKTFLKGHIPGSQWMKWENFTVRKPGTMSAITGKTKDWGKIPEADPKIQERLRGLGLSNSKLIVVVGEPRRWGEEGRIAWNLLFWGADEVALLEGGFPAWRASKERPVASGKAVPAERGDFTFHLRPERRALIGEVKKIVESGGRPLIDARSREEFMGTRVTGQKRGGRLPNAIPVPVSVLYNDEGNYISKETLLRITELSETDSPVAYGAGGVRSALFVLLWEVRMGTVASNYDGSMWEWSADPKLPLKP